MHQLKYSIAFEYVLHLFVFSVSIATSFSGCLPDLTEIRVGQSAEFTLGYNHLAEPVVLDLDIKTIENGIYLN